MTIGTVQVDFAGSLTEARDFAKENGVNASNKLSRSGGDGGLPVLSISFKNEKELESAMDKFDRLGWSRHGEQLVVRY